MQENCTRMRSQSKVWDEQAHGMEKKNAGAGRFEADKKGKEKKGTCLSSLIGN